MNIKFLLAVIFLLAHSTYTQNASCLKQETILIRAATEQDCGAIKALGVQTFTHVYNYTNQEQIHGLEKAYDAIIAEEQSHLHDLTRCVLVAVCHGKIVGFLSANITDTAHELYGRTLMVDPSFHKQGIGKSLLRHCLEQFPKVTKAVCLTNKKNMNAQKLYAILGGTRVDSPTWAKYLYKNLKTADFVGYEFDRSALAALQ